MKRITGIVAAALLMALLTVSFAGCGNTVTISVFNWGEYMDETLLDKFEEETGIKVNYSMYENNEGMLAKIDAGGTDFDVVFPSDYAIAEMIGKNMLAPIDFANVPNYRYIDERTKNQPFDPENRYSVPYFWGTLGILYNKDLVTDPVDSWNILWDEKYAGKIIMKKDVRDAMAVAAKKLGFSVNTTDMNELEQMKQSLILQKPLLNGYYGDEIKDMIANGDAAMGVTYSGDPMDLYWDETDFSYVGYAIPEEGTNLWFDSMVIPATTKHKAEAEKFINFMLDPENAYLNSEAVGYTTPNTEALARMKEQYPEIFEMDAYWPGDDVLGSSEVYSDLGDMRSTYNRIFTEVLAD